MDAHTCTIGRLIEDLDYDADICLSISPIDGLFRSVSGRWLVDDEWIRARLILGPTITCYLCGA